MCETRDLGIQWPRWHTLTFEGQVTREHETRVPKRRKENTHETGEIELLEEVGSEARV